MIQAQSADGVTHEFPDGTDPSVIDRVMKQYAQQQAGPAPASPDVDPMTGKAPAQDQGWLSRQLTGIQQFIGGPTDALRQGATLGLADEVGAAGGALGDAIGRSITGKSPNGLSSLVTGQQSDYSRNLEQIRGRQQAWGEEHPIANIGLNVVGGLGSVAGGMAGQVPSLLRGTAQAAGMGAVAGGASAEGGPYERLIGALAGGTIGGALGAGVPLAISGISQLGSRAMNAVAPGLGNQEAKAANVMSNYLRRDLEGTGRTIDDLANELADARAAGIPLSLMDVAGSNMTRLGRLAASAPGQASQQAEQFVAGSRAEVPYLAQNAMSRAVAPRGAAGQSVQELAQQRAAEAAPLYEQAFQRGQAVTNDRIQGFLQDPIIRQGIGRGMEIQRLEALAQNRRFDPMDYGITGFNEAGDPIISGVPNMRLLDSAKRGLDAILEDYRDPVTRRLNLDERGRAIEMVRRAWVSTLDEAGPPEYSAARAAWAGPTESMNAVNAGRNFIRGEPDAMIERFARLSEGDQQLFRLGVGEELSRMVGEGRLGQLQRLMNQSPDFAQKLQAFLDPEQFGRLQRDMQAIGTIQRRNNVIGGGSPTARIMAEQADAAGSEGRLGATMGLLNAYRGGGLTGAAGHLLTRGYGRSVGLSEDVAADIGRGLFTTEEPLQRALIGRLARQGQSNANREQIRRAMLATLLGGASTASGRAIAPQEAN
ncbi:hypothetical protein [Inquilinus limosus]|uniref:Uncharacterized protein n=1 Tax=Inquilinus limosus MP06 TaxID=1398085 RepID=A0A0A0DCF6_9PROT|nr:hypothetical protein [Inquilinus limosus]KGM35705.1 hypothetical protein P409_02990 [Inquilinus limosus MP06]